jgi:hypothetical protein
MLKIVTSKLHRWSESFFDEMADADWGGPAPDIGNIGRISPGPDKPTNRIEPHGPQGVINEDNYIDYEPSYVDKNPESQMPVRDSDYSPEMQMEDEEVGIPRGTKTVPYDGSEDPFSGQSQNQQKQVYDGIDNNEVISFDYTTRHGRYAGRRIVEPHYTFPARTTGNEVLVTFDRTKNDIRAFIVGNIHPNGVRYENVLFEPRGEIMKGIRNE